MLKLQIGLLGIPIQTTNFSNSRYASSGLHQFSVCCNGEVGNKNYCKSCGKIVGKEEIKKGVDKDTILSETQQEALKQALEGGLMEVLGIKEITETTTYDILPYVIKAQMISPSISKGYKKVDIKTFYSFKSALKELNKFCFVKLTQRATEHIGVLLNWKEDLVFIELPFKHYSNISQQMQVKDSVNSLIKIESIADLEGFKEQAQGFITAYKSRVSDVNEITEDKKVLLNALVEEIKTGVKPQEIKINEVNPFA